MRLRDLDYERGGFVEKEKKKREKEEEEKRADELISLKICWEIEISVASINGQSDSS